VSLLLMVAALVLMATTSAFAFSTATDQQSNTTNGGPQNGSGFVGTLTLNVASLETVISSYTFASSAGSISAANTGTGTTIRVMYQQWRHLQQNDWFYLYAVNSATLGSQATPVFDYYYYTPMRGATRVGASVANNTAIASATTGAASIVFLTSTSNVPAFTIESLTANSQVCTSAVGANCSASLNAQLRWGIAQQGFRAEASTSTMLLQQAVESFPIPTSATSTHTVYYDAWEPITGTGGDSSSTVRLNDTAPTQSASGVTNASGARNANTASAYRSIQTVADADADLSSGQLVWVFASGTNAGQWFQAGVYFQRAGSGNRLPGTYSVFYQSWNEATVNTTASSQITTNYFNSLTVSASPTLVNRGGDQLGISTADITYDYIYSTSARGSVNLIGRAEDWHGRSSGNVTVGTQTIS